MKVFCILHFKEIYIPVYNMHSKNMCICIFSVFPFLDESAMSIK